jgi:hypothetical protein
MKKWIRSSRWIVPVLTIILCCLLAVIITYAAGTWTPTTMSSTGTLTVNPAPSTTPTPVFSYSVNGVVAPGAVTLNWGAASMIYGTQMPMMRANFTVTNSASSTAAIKLLSILTGGGGIPDTWFLINDATSHNLSRGGIDVNIAPGVTWSGFFSIEHSPAQSPTPVGTYDLSTFTITLTPS